MEKNLIVAEDDCIIHTDDFNAVEYLLTNINWEIFNGNPCNKDINIIYHHRHNSNYIVLFFGNTKSNFVIYNKSIIKPLINDIQNLCSVSDKLVSTVLNVDRLYDKYKTVTILPYISTVSESFSDIENKTYAESKAINDTMLVMYNMILKKDKIVFINLPYETFPQFCDVNCIYLVEVMDENLSNITVGETDNLYIIKLSEKKYQFENNIKLLYFKYVMPSVL